MSGERFWPARLRWRLKGASMWPAFFGLTLVDAILLQVMPVSGETGPENLAPALILAGFLNLIVVAALAPPAGRLLRRRRRDLPRSVATDKAGTVLLIGATAAIAVAGLVHRQALRELRADRAAAAVAGHRQLGGTLAAIDALRLREDEYRVCRPSDTEARRADCVFVYTDQSPPGIQRDPSREPNDGFRIHGGFR